MKFYRAVFLNNKYIKAAPIGVMTENMRKIVTPKASGGMTEYSGKFTSTEAIKAGALVIGEDEFGMSVFKIAAPTRGMSKIYTYRLAEEAQI